MTGKQQTCDVWFDVFDERTQKWMPTKFKARCFRHERDGIERIYNLFKIGVLAKVLFRSTKSVRSWESQGSIPRPRFFLAGPRDHLVGESPEIRWYSEEQIRMFSSHQRGLLGEDPRASKGHSMNLETFFASVREDWNIEHFEEEDYEYESQESLTGKNDVHVQ